MIYIIQFVAWFIIVFLIAKYYEDFFDKHTFLIVFGIGIILYLILTLIQNIITQI